MTETPEPLEAREGPWLHAHEVATILACGVALIGADRLPAGGQIVLLVAAVALVGMPHGGLDHLTGAVLFRPRFGSYWWLPFGLVYLFGSALVLAGWVFLPLATITLFFAVSAWHFGSTEFGTPAEKIIFGGMPIWLPLLARPHEAIRYLGWVTPGEMAATLEACLMQARPLLWLAAAGAAVYLGKRCVFAASRRDLFSAVDAVRLAALAALFVTVPVLVGFVIAFAGWHSCRELCRMAQRLRPGRPLDGLRAVLLRAAPLSMAALFLTSGGAFWAWDGRAPDAATVQAVFLALSAVAIPHILLHAVAARFGMDALSRDVEPAG